METWLLVLLLAVAGLLLTCWLAWRLVRRFARPPKELVSRIERLSWAGRIAVAVGLMRDERLPIGIRLLIPAVALYLVLPFDIIPDFIPLIGALDDVLIVMLALRLLLRSIPPDVLDYHLSRQEGIHPELPSGEVPKVQ